MVDRVRSDGVADNVITTARDPQRRGVEHAFYDNSVAERRERLEGRTAASTIYWPAYGRRRSLARVDERATDAIITRRRTPLARTRDVGQVIARTSRSVRQSTPCDSLGRRARVRRQPLERSVHRES